MDQILIIALLGFAALVIFVLGKKPWINKTARISRETQAGEFMEISLNIPFWKSRQSIEAEVSSMLEVGDVRHKEVYERFQRTVAEEEAKQQAAVKTIGKSGR